MPIVRDINGDTALMCVMVSSRLCTVLVIEGAMLAVHCLMCQRALATCARGAADCCHAGWYDHDNLR
jgi:hypothetical protein